MQLVAYASSARTASPTAVTLQTQRARALDVVIDVTAKGAAPSVTFTVAGVDTLSGKTFTLVVSAAITAIGTTVLRIGPGLTAVANLTVNDFVPDTVRITPAHGNGDSITYSVGVHVIK